MGNMSRYKKMDMIRNVEGTRLEKVNVKIVRERSGVLRWWSE